MEQTMNREAGPAYRKVIVEENRVSLTVSLDWLRAGLATAAYAFILYALFDYGFPHRRFSLTSLVVFLAFSAAWLWYVARQKSVAVFDANDRKVHRRNLLYGLPDIDFSEIAEITAVGESGGGSGGTYFKIAFKADKLGKGVRITDNYRGTDLEFVHLTQKALPAITAMLEADNAGAPDRSAGLVENPSRYVKTGSQYVQKRWGRIGGAIAIGLVLLVYGFQKGAFGLCLGGAAVLLYSVFVVNVVVLDTAAKTITLAKAFGFWKSTYAMERFVGISVTRTHTNGLYSGTSADIEFANPAKTVQLAHVYFTKGLSVLVDESNAIINHALGRTEGNDA